MPGRMLESRSFNSKKGSNMALSGAQVRALRSKAHHLDPVISIGKADITDHIINHTDTMLEGHELIKCSVQDGCTLGIREAADALAEAVNAEVVQVIGHRFSLYRYSHKQDIEHVL